MNTLWIIAGVGWYDERRAGLAILVCDISSRSGKLVVNLSGSSVREHISRRIKIDVLSF